MKGIDKKIQEIKQQKIGSSQKRVLLVEGNDDLLSFELLLSKIIPDWGNSWVLAFAGKKSAVIEILVRETSWLGIIDRDEWDGAKIEQLSAEMENLLFLPRYCIENYLIIPAELWSALPDKQKAKVANGQEELESLILADRDKWVKHGVLWSVINPLWEGLRSLGFKEKLLDITIINDEAAIQSTLDEWHSFLNPHEIWQRYQQRLAEVNAKPDDEKLRLHIHGKLFYEQVVNPVLNQLLGQKSADERQFAIIRTLPAVTDLDELLDKMGHTTGVDA